MPSQYLKFDSSYHRRDYSGSVPFQKQKYRVKVEVEATCGNNRQTFQN
jgi:hypothetical protein